MGNSCLTGAPSSLLGKTRAPAFEWKIYGFSALLERGAIGAYSSSFHYSGYKWYLKLTPMHEKSDEGIAYVALHLCLHKVDVLKDHTINAVFELSLYNQSNGTYCGFKARSSFTMKTAYSKKLCLIRLEELLTSSDFLVDDSCVFGVRILKAHVSSPEKKPITIPKEPITYQKVFLQKKGFTSQSYTWTVENYVALKNYYVSSPMFEACGHNWHMSMFPLGDEYSTNSLSLSLYLSDRNNLSDSESGMMIETTLSILDQKDGAHYSIKGRVPFRGGGATAGWGWRWSNFIQLDIFNDPSRGYLVGSKCILKGDITIIGSSSH